MFLFILWYSIRKGRIWKDEPNENPESPTAKNNESNALKGQKCLCINTMVYNISQSSDAPAFVKYLCMDLDLEVYTFVCMHFCGSVCASRVL